MLNIHSIESFGTHEGPGIRLVLFLQGCRFRCLYCHNPDTWAIGAGREIKDLEILALLQKEKPYFGESGGLTVSGGEPLLQRKELVDLFRKVKQKGFTTCLDTNGSILDSETKKLLEYTDLVLLDVKHIDPKLHFKLTKSSNLITLKFAEYCRKIQKPVWLRYVLVPGFTDQTDFLDQWAKTFSDYKNIKRVEILPYHTFGVYKYKELGLNYPLKSVTPPNQKQIDATKKIFGQYFETVVVR